MKTNAYGQEWADLDLSASNRDRAILDGYTFGTLLLEVGCNLPDITPETVARQFEDTLRAKMESAREVFALNAEDIYLTALAERQADSDTEDDYGKPYIGELRRIPLPHGAGLLVGPAGYLEAKHNERFPIPRWADLEAYNPNA